MTMPSVDLNCDMGEGFGVYSIGNDAEMLRIVSSANIACGFHGGDPIIIHETLSLAAERHVQAGAHPSLFDLWGFGRRPILGERPADIEKQVIYQIGALQALAQSVGTRLRHVKTHGSLGNMAAEDASLAEAVARAVRVVDPELIFVALPGMETERAAKKFGLRVAREIYADRAYADNGNLASRKLDGAVIHDPDLAASRVVRMIEDQAITTMSGRRIPVKIDSICVHGDTPGAVEMARKVRDSLVSQGVDIRPMAEVVGS
jgi:5-oxoprolinase (ATP-hydrolysing) subunit A